MSPPNASWNSPNERVWYIVIMQVVKHSIFLDSPKLISASVMQDKAISLSLSTASVSTVGSPAPGLCDFPVR